MIIQVAAAMSQLLTPGGVYSTPGKGIPPCGSWGGVKTQKTRVIEMPKDRMDPSQIQQAIQFSERLLEFDGWVKKAEELLAAASLLESEIRQMWAETEMDNGRIVRTSGRANVQASHFMLNAYAMENYFKALLLFRNRESWRNRLMRRLPSYLKQHDLIKLAKEAKLSLSVPEEELLARLSRD